MYVILMLAIPLPVIAKYSVINIDYSCIKFMMEKNSFGIEPWLLV
jgi:hypothetical protein